MPREVSTYNTAAYSTLPEAIQSKPSRSALKTSCQAIVRSPNTPNVPHPVAWAKPWVSPPRPADATAYRATARYVRAMASRGFFRLTEKKIDTADSPRTVPTVAAVPASSKSGSMPPKSCRKAMTGSPAKTYMSSVITRAASLPKTISCPVRSVASRNSRVFRSFSSAMHPAT